MNKTVRMVTIILLMLFLIITIFSISLIPTQSYFSSTKNAEGRIELGHLFLNSLTIFDEEDEFLANKIILPNQKLKLSCRLLVDSTVDYYLRFSFSFLVTGGGDAHSSTCKEELDSPIANFEVEGFTQFESDNKIYFYRPSPQDKSTKEENISVLVHFPDWIGSVNCNYFMGANIVINCKTEAIQSDYVNGTKLGETFTEDNISLLHEIWSNVM